MYSFEEKMKAVNLYIKHYRNTVLFHGHSHLKFKLQEMDKKANYSSALGFRSVHIPSITVPRDSVDSVLTDLTGASVGYVVDVYENGIHLRGRDFVKAPSRPLQATGLIPRCRWWQQIPTLTALASLIPSLQAYRHQKATKYPPAFYLVN